MAKQEQELDEAFDALQVDLRKVPCKDWHKVEPQPVVRDTLCFLLRIA